MASPSIKFSYSIPDKTNPRPSRQPVDSAGKRCGARTRACRVLAILPTHGFCPQRRSRQGLPVSLRPLRPQQNEPNRYSSPRFLRVQSGAPRTKRTQSLFVSAIYSPRPRNSASSPAPPAHKTNPTVIPLRDFLRVPASPRPVRRFPRAKRTQSLFLSALFSASPRLRVQSGPPAQNEPNHYSSPRFSPRPRVSASNPALSLNKTNPTVIPLRDFLRVPASPRPIRRPSTEVNLPKTIVS